MNLSPGLAQSAFELLRLIGRQGLNIPALLAGMERIGGMPSSEVLELAQTLNWVAISEAGTLAVTDQGGRVIDDGAYPTMLRQTVLDYVDILSPPWLQNAADGRRRAIAFAPVGVGQVLVEAEVAEGAGDDVVAFWDMLAARARGRRNERLLSIGRQGERLTLAHETDRTGRTPHWVALDSNADGFDVLSIRASDDLAPLTIEVKTTTQGLRGLMTLTHNEWMAAATASAHLFHLWDAAPRAQPRLATVTVDAMAEHIPEDRGDGGWQLVEVPFSTFADQFNAC
jgi:hypothetical protein